jgi:hypothetical protein
MERDPDVQKLLGEAAEDLRELCQGFVDSIRNLGLRRL